ASFSVTAQMRSAWPATPLAAQSLEFIRDVDAAEAGAFLRALGDGSGLAASDGGLGVAEGLLRSASARSFHELLARNSYYSPRIEASRSLGRQDRRAFGSACAAGAAWALLWVAGAEAPVAACDAAALRSALGGAHPAGVVGFVPWELDLALRRGSRGCTAVVYGAVSAGGLPSLAPLLGEVDALGAASPCGAVFRHADGPAGEQSGGDVLTGYGFELAIKSSEYKTHADEKQDGEGEEAGDKGGGDGAEDGDVEAQDDKELDGPLEIDGLLLHVLLKRPKGVVRSRLWALKEQLEAERDTDTVLKAWEIKDIGLQAAAKIKSSTTPLLTLMRLSQNFPAHVAGLARNSVPESLRRGMSKLRNTIQDGGEVFSVNNRLVRPDHSDLSLFPMIKTLQPTFVGVERMVRAGASEALACEMLREGTGVSPPERLDWRSPMLPPTVYTVNRDKRAARWPLALQSMLSMFMGGLIPVRLPLYTVVFTLDPADPADLQQAAEFLESMPLPVNVHFVMLPGGARPAAAAEWDEDFLGQAPAWVASAGAEDGAAASTSDGASVAIAASFAHMLAMSPAKARKYVKALAEHAALFAEEGGRWPDTQEGVDKIRQIFVGILGVDDPEFWETVLSTATGRGSAVANATEYVASLGVPVPSFLINGKLMLKDAYEGEQGMQAIYQTIAMEQGMFQKAVYMQQLLSGDQVEGFLESQGFLSAYHADITPEVAQRGGEDGMPGHTAEVAYLQWPGEAFLAQPFLVSVELEPEGDAAPTGRLGFYHVTVLRRLGQARLLHTFASHMLRPDRAALDANKQLKVPPFASHWAPLVDAEDGGTASPALAELRACLGGALQVRADGEEATYSLNRQRLLLFKFLGQALPAALGTASDLPGERVRELCELAVEKKIDPDHRALVRGAIAAARSAEGAARLSGSPLLAAAAAAAGERGSALWVCNGRQVSLAAGGQPISARHVQALELLEAQYDVSSRGGGAAEDDEDGEAAPQSTKALFELVAEEAAAGALEVLSPQAQGLVAAIRSEALSQGGAKYTQPRQVFEIAPPAFRVQVPPARPEAASPIKVYGILDPLSPTAQSASAVLALFGMTFNAEVNLLLNPNARHSEYPLKRYYREVIRWPTRLADGRRVEEVEGFGDAGRGRAEVPLATRHTLTAAVHVMPTWLVTAQEAEHDMDNLRLVGVGDGKVCETTYELRSLYVEGQAFILGPDGWPTAPAKGLQIEVLPKGAQAAFDDTIVMGNLGYFQVRGPPGLYDVVLKQGPSNDTFEAASVKDLQVASYATPPYQVRVRTRPGRSHQDLFEEGGMQVPKASFGLSSLFGGLSSFLGESAPAPPPPPPTPKASAPTVADGVLPTIHIFSVASGHLYEKLLGIMIMSVRTKTKCPLHFWFIDQFLSPKFKEFIPKFAKKYNFGFDFVTYKWPSWLNPQSEKQRLIWAYKIQLRCRAIPPPARWRILFLDVLFPMDVPKVIFIDADQVVRADVRELWDMDLEGKVYGFTPMGNTNPDTEGFRFWKQGYWQSHLGDLNYHISALFVVDLVEFRRTSIGETLRGVYNQLSRDPNSLANLDQDLPNFAQHQIPIFSLPEEWLWCETWCSQESKARAKTIDLCQNPLTKEPKIVMAQRIISEWQGYHDEVQRFQEEVAALPEAARGAEEAPGISSKPEL
ncbi:unnamed protein product, partial [Prorocentrum cordatum]